MWNGKGQCNVWSGCLYADAAPLRRGSLYCHHHRVRCEGHTRRGTRCAVTSSCQHEHAAPLRQGSRYCTHHADGDDAPDDFELYECEACGELQAVPAGHPALEHACPVCPVREDDYELYECEACGELQAAKIGEASRHTCQVTGTTSVAVPVAEDPESDGDYDPSSGGWGSAVSGLCWQP